jgi:HlyD family secretion protein
VLSDSRSAYVLLVGAQNRIERRDVQIGGTIAAGVIITKGLTGDEKVVTTAAGFLREGEKVNVAPPTAAAAAAAA